jgi:hypothetical protein
MTVEADAVGGLAKGGRLAYIVEQGAPGEGDGAAGLELVEEHEGVGEDVALGVVLRGLLDALHAGDCGEDLGEEAGGVEELEGAAGMTFGEHAGELVADALAADGGGFWGESLDGRGGGGVDIELEAGSEADAAQHAEVVFFKAEFGAADGADDASIEIGDAVDVVDDGGAKGLQGQTTAAFFRG